MPHTKPERGRCKVPRSPFVAMSSDAANAHTSATASAARGSLRSVMQVNSMTNTMARLCSTVAVPAFVYATDITYVSCESSKPMLPNRNSAFSEFRSWNIACSLSRCAAASAAKKIAPAPIMRTVVRKSGEMAYPANRNWAQAPEKPQREAPTRAHTMPVAKLFTGVLSGLAAHCNGFTLAMPRKGRPPSAAKRTFPIRFK